jgi:hypothetical protein
MVGKSRYRLHDEKCVETSVVEASPLREFKWKVILSVAEPDQDLDERPDQLVFPSRNAAITWASNNGHSDLAAKLRATIPDDDAAATNGQKKGLTVERRVERVKFDEKPRRSTVIPPDLDEKLQELERELSVEERLDAVERAAVLRKQEAAMADVEAIADRLGKPITSREVFLEYTGRPRDGESRTLFLYSGQYCAGNVFVVSSYIGNLASVMGWTPQSARSAGYTAMWDVTYPDPDIPDPVPRTVSQSGTQEWPVFDDDVPVPLAATSF